MSSPDYSTITQLSIVFVLMIGLDRVVSFIALPVKHLKSVDNLNVATACHLPRNEGIPEYLLPSFLPTQSDLSIKINGKQESLLSC